MLELLPDFDGPIQLIVRRGRPGALVLAVLGLKLHAAELLLQGGLAFGLELPAGLVVAIQDVEPIHERLLSL